MKLFFIILQTSLLIVADSFIVHPSQSSCTCLHVASHDTSEASHFISTSALKDIYPQLVAWKEEHGHPNIPLGEEGGEQCQIVRQLHIQQNQLTKVEVDILEELGFEFYLSGEQLYWNNDFDEMVRRMSANNNKCDPEVKAWMKGIRKLGKDRIRPEHALLLAYNGFSWEEEDEKLEDDSSSFKTKYREIRENAQLYGRAYLLDPKIQQWIRKQEALKKEGLLSDSQYNYVLKLIGSENEKLTP